MSNENYEGYYDYAPLPAWQRIRDHFASRATGAGSELGRPMFELVKQVATSCVTVNVDAVIDADMLELSPSPRAADPRTQARVRVSCLDPAEITIELVAPDEDEGIAAEYPLAAAFPMLNTFMHRLAGQRPSPGADTQLG